MESVRGAVFNGEITRRIEEQTRGKCARCGVQWYSKDRGAHKIKPATYRCE